MRTTLILLAGAFALGSIGCGKPAPVTVTAEMQAEQKQAEKDVQNAESANRKTQKADKTHDQNVNDQESARQRR